MLTDRDPTLRVASLADRYPRRNETFIDREIAALRAQGMEVETFSLWPPPGFESVHAGERNTTFYLRSAGTLLVLEAHGRRLARNPIRYVRTLGLALRLAPPGYGRRAAWLRHFGAAVVLAHRMSARRLTHLHNHATDASCTVALLAAALGDLHFSFTIHGPGVFFTPEARRLEEKLRHARFVRCISYFCRSQCLIWTPPDRWPHLHVVHCGVDPQTYDVRAHDGPGSHLLFVGRLVAVKGLPILIEVFARLRARRAALRLTIVGDGPERAAIETRAREAGVADALCFTGYQTPEQVTGWLRTADVFVLPSFAEGVPVVLMEAMAAGVPVVATRVGGVGELVEDGVSGFLVPAAAPDALAQRIETLLDDPALRNRLAHAARAKVVRDFNLADEAVRLRHLFEWAVTDDTGAPWRGNHMREVLGA